jgi:hypothetical protein
MRKSFVFSFLLILAVAATGSSIAQTPAAAPVKHYKADFVVQEIDAGGHVLNTRSFSSILATTNEGAPVEIRSGDRIPIRSSTDEKGSEVKFQYIDLGVNIDCQHVREVDQKLALSIRADVSSIPAGTDLKTTLGPIIRGFKWNADVLISPGVPTTVFSSDDMSSKTKVQFEVTATLIK